MELRMTKMDKKEMELNNQQLDQLHFQFCVSNDQLKVGIYGWKDVF